MNKICVYTCITGEYDNLKEIKNKEKKIDYYCFTNNKNIKSKTWNVIYIEDESLSNIVLARKIKILGHPIINEKYDILLWMDAAVEFNKNIVDFIDNYLTDEDSFVGFKHGERNSILEEMDACIRFRKENKDNIENLKKIYKKESYKYDNGLIESTVLIKRPKDKKVMQTMDLWFKMVENYSKRDQLSFNYCIFKTDLNVKWIDEKVFNNKWFKWFNHNSNNIISEYVIYYGNIFENYDYRNQYIHKYKIKDNVYIIDEKIKQDTDTLYIELSNVSLVNYKIKNINIDKKNIKYINSININDETIFYNTLGAIVLNKELKKGEKVHIEIKFEKLKDHDVMFFTNNIINEYQQLKAEYDQLLNEKERLQLFHDKTVNSKFYKLKRKLFHR